MWRITRTEIVYHKMIFLIYLIMTIGITFLERTLDDGGRFYTAMLLFLIVQNWLSFKAKQKRDLQLARLPLAAGVQGSVRILMIFIAALLVVLVYKGMHLLLGIQGHANYPVTHWKLLSHFSLVLLGFSVYFIFSDFISPKLRELTNYQTMKERMLQIFLLTAVILQILGLVAFMTKAPNLVTNIFDLIYHHNPFDKTSNIQILFIVSLISAAISIQTYSLRKNYIA